MCHETRVTDVLSPRLLSSPLDQNAQSDTSPSYQNGHSQGLLEEAPKNITKHKIREEARGVRHGVTPGVTPGRRIHSPEGRILSPGRRMHSPEGIIHSPGRRMHSPEGRIHSPGRRMSLNHRCCSVVTIQMELC